MVDANVELEEMQDRPKDQEEELIEVNLAKEGRSAQPVFVSASLSLKHKMALFKLLREEEDVFVCSYGEIPGLDPHMVMHQLNIKQLTMLIKQTAKNFKSKPEVQIKQ